MKFVSAIAPLALVACETMSTPIGSGDFDPLRPPGSNLGAVADLQPRFTAGQLVRASMDNTAFFRKRPRGDGDADKLLSKGSSMKVVSTNDSYLKVELDSGEIGFVPAVMVEDPNEAAGPGEVQVYPPLNGMGGDTSLPPLDPEGLPPDGAIPTVIDPDAPPSLEPVPPVAPGNGDFAAPEDSATGPAPLPPNEEELKEAAEGSADDKAGSE